MIRLVLYIIYFYQPNFYISQDCSVFGKFLHEPLAGQVEVSVHNKHGFDGRNSEPIYGCCPYIIHLGEHSLDWCITSR